MRLKWCLLLFKTFRVLFVLGVVFGSMVLVTDMTGDAWQYVLIDVVALVGLGLGWLGMTRMVRIVRSRQEGLS